jgi:3-deoxy-D-manno-octulosonic-acid transferase
MLTLYRAATFLATPLVRLYLAARMARGKEDRARFGERLGRPGLPRPDGPLVWAHAASIGESLSMMPLVERLLGERPGLGILFTTGTVTSAAMMAERLPKGAFHQYIPVDRLSYVRRFLDHWRPDLVLWAESEFWPNLVTESAARKVPVILVNGRVSPRSFAGWRRAPGLIRRVLAGFTLCLGQAEIDAGRLRRLGAGKAKSVGNLKFAAPPLPADAKALDLLSAELGDRPRWLAASTHPGEETIMAAVHRRLGADRPDLLTIIVPRHPERGAAIAQTLRRGGHSVALRSAGETIAAATDIYLADTLGELGLFFRLADVVFMGKSLVPLGGQNPIEPARLGCALIHGPHMANFEDMAAQMKETGAAAEVADEAALAIAVAHLLDDADRRWASIEAAHAFAEAEAHVLDAVVAELAPFLDTLPKAGDESADA